MSIANPPPLVRSAPIVYDSLVPGECLGSTQLAVDADMLRQWHAVYGYTPEGQTLPLAFAPLLLMRAMLTIAAPRPPGNLHVGQGYRIFRMPRRDDSIVAQVTCRSKEIRKQRRVVELETTLSETLGDEPIVVGRSAIFWAQ